jgi:hypothetical protein
VQALPEYAAHFAAIADEVLSLTAAEKYRSLEVHP